MRGIYWSKQWKNHTYIFILLSFMVSFKTINKNKSNYKVVVCVCQKGFLLLWRHHLQIWLPVITAASKPYYGIVLFSEMVLRVCNSLGMKRFQIAQFMGYFYIVCLLYQHRAHSKSTFVEERRGSLKSELKRTGGGGSPGMCVSSLF